MKFRTMVPDAEQRLRDLEARNESAGGVLFKIKDDPRVTPVLIAETLVGHDKKTYNDQVVAWATERKDGGRSFGFTGAHFHKNWGDADFRKLVLNAILWSAKVEVPSSGVKCDVSEEELKENLDPKGRK